MSKEYTFEETHFEGLRRTENMDGEEVVETYRQYDVKITIDDLTKDEVDVLRDVIRSIANKPAASEVKR